MSACVWRWIALSSFCVLGIAVSVWVRHPSDAADSGPENLKSQVVTWDAARSNRADWGEMRRYFTGQTFGTKDAFTAVAVIEPGKAVHRAHRHAEEEYLALVDGFGTWHLAGKEFPARRGDILYVEPWVFHGLTNTGDKPLTFVVVKFNSKGVTIPPRPDNRKDEL